MFQNSFCKSIVAIALALPMVSLTGYSALAQTEAEPTKPAQTETEPTETEPTEPAQTETEPTEPAQTGAVSFTLINKTSRTLESFYASPPSTNDWEEDILGVDVLPPGESVKITIDDGRTDCLYDIKGVLGPSEDGSVGRGELIQSSVRICDDDGDGTITYEYTEK